VIEFFFKLLSRLSLKNLQRLGALLGVLAYVGSKHYRGLLKTHFDLAAHLYKFNPNYWQASKESGKTMADCLWIWNHPEQALKLTEIHDWEIVEAAIAEGKGLIMLTPHLGGFEVIPRVLAEHFPATILYRPARQKWLDDIIVKGRKHPRMNFVPANLQGIRHVAKALQKGEAVGILPDQVPKDSEGIWAKFFGKYAYTITLPAKIASRNDVPTVMFTAIRKAKGAGWILQAKRMGEAFDPDPHRAAQQLNQLLEEAILQKPEQYLWAYNRFKNPTGSPPPSESSDFPS